MRKQFIPMYVPKMKKQNERAQARSAKYEAMFPTPPKGWASVETSTPTDD